MIFALLFLVSSVAAAAPICSVGTLDTTEPCMIGSALFSGFALAPGNTTLTPAAVQVIPLADEIGLQFGLAVAVFPGGERQSFAISYQVSGLQLYAAETEAEGVVLEPGSMSVYSDFEGTAATVALSEDLSRSSAEVHFADPLDVLFVSNHVTLESDGPGAAVATLIRNSFDTPEPLSLVLLGSGLAGLGLFRRYSS